MIKDLGGVTNANELVRIADIDAISIKSRTRENQRVKKENV